MTARKRRHIHIEMANPRELSLAHGVHVGKKSRRKLEFIVGCKTEWKLKGARRAQNWGKCNLRKQLQKGRPHLKSSHSFVSVLNRTHKQCICKILC